MNLCDTPSIIISSPPIILQQQLCNTTAKQNRNELTTSYSYPPSSQQQQQPSQPSPSLLQQQQQQQPTLIEKSSKEYHLCALFSILYPFKSNFGNSLGDIHSNVNGGHHLFNNNNNNGGGGLTIPFVPVLEDNQPIKSWSEIMDDEDQEMEMNQLNDDTTSSYSDISSSTTTTFNNETGMFDMDDDSDNESIKKKKKQLKKTINNNNNNNSTLPSSSSSTNKTKKKNGNGNNKSMKKIFIGGIKFDDLTDEEERQVRILKILHLFQSLGKIESVDAHWEKGYCFITYLQHGIAQRVVQQMSNHTKRSKMLQNIKSSLSRDNLNVKCTPLPTFYVRLPSNKSNNNGSNNKPK
ncbi:RNA-binding region RNP-1 domain-containing protein [Cavenderia fasciculata]|uniref:RNA-binding region RNP-1 domain-containing protein n=1 Tax=Cavenderia fasciculata TaxID=261658 RepID=F4PMX6_CACFS|nr:RNA-binding region RNP-1 domain-containing protein [Cavenderia fasciculata]EGG22869.1 RNA-binding region RNP-1 domain-containing protein [Cavenderia fasciculata]|eukprot:XP_004360720.1 RNA-binding region RNP-1 domain-containing protein [Cavenderia fasciculata]